VVRAVGTAFVVRLQPKGIEVTVTKGTVELASLTSTRPVSSLSRAQALPRHVLTMVTADRGTTELAVLAPSHQVEKLDLAPPEATRKLAWRQGMLVFTGESLPSVVADVSRYTDVQIEIADPGLNDLKVGGYFKVGEVEPMLEALEGSFGVRVERLDAKHVRLSARL
jgi:transmembrane sensor